MRGLIQGFSRERDSTFIDFSGLATFLYEVCCKLCCGGRVPGELLPTGGPLYHGEEVLAGRGGVRHTLSVVLRPQPQQREAALQGGAGGGREVAAVHHSQQGRDGGAGQAGRAGGQQAAAQRQAVQSHRPARLLRLQQLPDSHRSQQ